ncbi:MAG TPA: hypothetical protein DIW86_14140 [Pseudomonas sp.]|nr:hypothetical protein [Pseudomonas sp.]
MSSMVFFLRTDNPGQLKGFIDESLDCNIVLVRIDPTSALELSGSGSEGAGEWYEWYTYANWASFEHCLYISVIEGGASFHTGFLELHSVCLDLELAGNPGRGLRFNRSVFLEHLERYRAAPGWFDDEGHRRFPFPEEVVVNNMERPDYLARFNIEKF